MAALTINGMVIPVAASGGAGADWLEVGGEVVRAYDGTLLSTIKAHARVWRVQTPPMTEGEARDMRAMLRSPWAVPCDGSLIGGTVLCLVRSLRSRPIAASRGPRWVLEFELHEQGVRPFDGNLVRNPGFEDGGTGWQQGNIGGATRRYLSDPAKARSGSGYAEMSGLGSGGQILTYYGNTSPDNVYFPVAPGDVVTFGGWCARDAGDGPVRVRLTAYDAGKGSPSYTSTAPNVVGPDYVESKATYTVPAGKAYVALALQVGGGITVSTTARFDDVYLRIRRAGT